MTLRALVLLLFAAACGGGESTGGEATSGGDDDGWDDWGDDEAPTVQSNHGAIEALGISPPEDKPWEEMNHEEREWYMIGKFLPIMKEVFGEHDAERWSPETYGCETCHGENGEENGYAMPPPDSYPIPPADSPQYEQMKTIFGDLVTFMEERVTPVSGTLIGEEEEHTCWDCHRSTEPAAEPRRERRRRRRRRGRRGRRR
ncbi:MAG: hypothetical protein AAF411_24970 [Myxococcota bacterium]